MVEELDLSALRVNYNPDLAVNKSSELNSTVWYEIFAQWFSEACEQGQLEPNAMVLGTVDSQGEVDTRTVLAKKVDVQGVVFYTNYHSAKARALAVHSQASLTFLWLSIHRQVRFSGIASQCSPEENAQYWKLRPRESQIGAWASEQSSPVASRDDLLAKYEKYEKQFADSAEIPLPSNWGGYRVVPHKIEFWVGRTGRFHDRFEFRLTDDATDVWEVRRLQP